MRLFYGETKTMPIRAKFVALASLFFALIAFPSVSPAADNAFVRINQLGYVTGSPARAYLMSKGAETGATFQVLNAKGVALFTAPVGASLGVWGNFNVFAIDFTPTSAGTFTLEVNGPMPATSPAFTVGTGKKLYSQALANALYFYQNERDGQNQTARWPLDPSLSRKSACAQNPHLPAAMRPAASPVK